MKKILLLLSIVFCLAGCQPASVEKPPLVTISDVPELTVVCQDNKVTAWQGTASWQIQNEAGVGNGFFADSPHPLAMQEHIPCLSLPSASVLHIEPLVANLQFEMVPDKVTVRCWSEACWGETDAESEELPVKTLMIDSDPPSDPIFQLNLKDGNYIYEVFAEWNQAELYGGDAHYSFCTAQSELCGYPVASTGE